MTIIEIQDLRPVGHDLFNGSESYLSDLLSDDELNIYGGSTPLCAFTAGLAISVSIISVSALSVYSLLTTLQGEV